MTHRTSSSNKKRPLFHVFSDPATAASSSCSKRTSRMTRINDQHQQQSLPPPPPVHGGGIVVEQTHNATTTSTTNNKRSIIPETFRQHLGQVRAHDTLDKRTEVRLRLHLTRTQRRVKELHQRLQAWDVVEEEEVAAKKHRLLEQQQQQNNDQQQTKKQRYRRPGPESWQLRGPARPACQVYDFDVRYEDPHIKAHQDAQLKIGRVQNILTLYQGQWGAAIQASEHPPTTITNTSSPFIPIPDFPVEVCRDYLSLQMQLGHLSREAAQYKSARAAWMECLRLEGPGYNLTTARDCLVRMYLDLKRYDSIISLGKQLLHDMCPVVDNASVENAGYKSENAVTVPAIRRNNDAITSHHSSSLWVLYSYAVVAHVLQKKNGDEDAQIDHLFVQAIRANPLCAYYIAFYQDSFQSVMEYTHEIVEGDDDLPGTVLDQAIEYAGSQYAKLWWRESPLTLHQQTNGNKARVGKKKPLMQRCGDDDYAATTTKKPNLPTRTAAQRMADILQQAVHGTHPSLTPDDVEWQPLLAQTLQIHANNMRSAVQIQPQQQSSVSNFQEAQEAIKSEDSVASHAIRGPSSNNREDENPLDHNSTTSLSTSSSHNSPPVDDDHDEDENENDNPASQVDLIMFAGMFRTAMEMLQDAGKLPSSSLSLSL